MRRLIAFALSCLACTAAVAQAGAPRVQEAQPLDARRNQKVERIQIEDDAVRIDETRYAGQTESITVQPKGGLPAYQIVPATPARTRLDDGRRGIGSGGERVWNVLSF